jgi:hypothetical protein
MAERAIGEKNELHTLLQETGSKKIRYGNETADAKMSLAYCGKIRHEVRTASS